MSSVASNKKLLLPSAHHYLVVVNVVPAERLDVANLHFVPRDVVDAARLLVDEVMVRLGLRIEDDAVVGEVERLEETFLDEEVQRVVDRGAGDVREAPLDALPDQIGRGMLVGLED